MESIQSIEVPVEFNKDNITIKMPIIFAKYLKLSKNGKFNTVFIIPTNGVLQLSGQYPKTTIPVELN